jgi:hypothetical protein
VTSSDKANQYVQAIDDKDTDHENSDDRQEWLNAWNKTDDHQNCAQNHRNDYELKQQHDHSASAYSRIWYRRILRDPAAKLCKKAAQSPKPAHEKYPAPEDTLI